MVGIVNIIDMLVKACSFLTFLTPYHQACLFFLVGLCYWIEKWNSRGHALEHLESSGIQFFYGWASCVQVWCGENQRNKQQRSLRINFKGFFTLSMVMLPIYCLGKGFKARLEYF